MGEQGFSICQGQWGVLGLCAPWEASLLAATELADYHSAVHSALQLSGTVGSTGLLCNYGGSPSGATHRLVGYSFPIISGKSSIFIFNREAEALSWLATVERA
jgi:hypothetical protein